MQRIYIAGCGGMLGEAFYKVFGAEFELKCSDIDVNEPWLSYLDFRDYDSYCNDVKTFNPHYLFHLGAHTDLEFCELNADDAYATNTLAVENAVFIANDLDIPLLYHQHRRDLRRQQGRVRRLGSAQSPGPLRAIQICRRDIRAGQCATSPHLQGRMDDGGWSEKGQKVRPEDHEAAQSGSQDALRGQRQARHTYLYA